MLVVAGAPARRETATLAAMDFKEEILPALRDGDLILVSASTVDGAALRWWSRAECTHVGLVLHVDGVPYLAHCDIQGLPDARTNTRHPGAQLTDLELYVRVHIEAGDRLYWRRRYSCGRCDSKPFEGKAAFATMSDARFEPSMVRMFRSACALRAFWPSSLFAGRSAPGRYYCTEFVLKMLELAQECPVALDIERVSPNEMMWAMEHVWQSPPVRII